MDAREAMLAAEPATKAGAKVITTDERATRDANIGSKRAEEGARNYRWRLRILRPLYRLARLWDFRDLRVALWRIGERDAPIFPNCFEEFQNFQKITSLHNRCCQAGSRREKSGKNSKRQLFRHHMLSAYSETSKIMPIRRH